MHMLADLPRLCYLQSNSYLLCAGVCCESVRPVTLQLQGKAACYGHIHVVYAHGHQDSAV